MSARGFTDFGFARGLRPRRLPAMSGWPMADLHPPFLLGLRPQTAPDGQCRIFHPPARHAARIEDRLWGSRPGCRVGGTACGRPACGGGAWHPARPTGRVPGSSREERQERRAWEKAFGPSCGKPAPQPLSEASATSPSKPRRASRPGSRDRWWGACTGNCGRRRRRLCRRPFRRHR